ncbi:tRNA wybutosine-synthesizing protein 2/3/4 isoform X2 [Amborella trichopoda]|uniref:tRNA wybutosine-synthesizing protein 2/3/4 isoform X2 n=1 Tax=Amborella trichopoda TaxID=13333 RepID=UPI0009BEDB94|nr:tRNA wybutosine-synthesizing protein 2/3/4 isoform X2 [Amborella trichopoda]|eukprot:XP_020530122.1 tRNA wybutosine-synthesizing protein 2/3/4 isoform X2 [Amborella trichopoda]
MEFEKRKGMALAALASELGDKSPKGSVDAPILLLLRTINAIPSYFTTSSCSGRISILLHPHTITKKNKKKAGDWLFVSHEPANPEAVVRLLFDEQEREQDGGLVVFRFEPFILAVDCIDVASAQSLVSTAISCGFRESGITGIGRRIMVSIRCSIRLEVPLGQLGRLMVSSEYVRFLVGLANEKFEENKRRTDAFLQALHMKGSPGSADSKKDFHDRIQGYSSMTRSKFADLESKQTDILCEMSSSEKDIPAACAAEPPNMHMEDEDPYDYRKFSVGSILLSYHSEIEHCKLDREETGHDSGSSNSLQHGLSVNELVISGELVEKLLLWGHSACVLDTTKFKQILVFGGFGGLGRHARQNESFTLDPKVGLLKKINVSGPPSPRIGHTLSVVGNHVFIIGGRGDPIQILDDVWVLHVDENRWEQLACSGSEFHARHRHAAAVVGSKIYVFGGLDCGRIYSSMFVLDTELLQWNEVCIKGELPCARHSHSMVAVSRKLYMFGGYDGERPLGDLYSFDVATSLWKKELTLGTNPSPRLSHCMFVYKRYVGILGGCPLGYQYQKLALLDLNDLVWKHVKLQSINESLLIRSAACVVEDDLVIIGGGASCYAFGTKFNAPLKINLYKIGLLPCGSCDIGDKSNAKIDEKGHDSNTGISICHGDDPLASHENDSMCKATKLSPVSYDAKFSDHTDIMAGSNSDNKCMKHWVLQIERAHAKFGKDILKNLGWLDLGRRVYSSKDGTQIYLPITKNCYPFLREKLMASAEGFDNWNGIYPKKLNSGKENFQSVDSLSILVNLLLSGGGSLTIDASPRARKAPKAPHHVLREEVCSLIKQKGLSPELLDQLPSRWERFGDLLILPMDSFKDKVWDSIGEELWPIVMKSLEANRLARQGRISPTGTRDSTVELLMGDNGWVEHQENGIIYTFDVTKCMFSSGNVSEKLRMAHLDCRNEVIVDLYAGIGYFVLPFLVKAGAKLVYACEWNPHALEALRHNVRANHVADRCIILEGDNQITAPRGIANRVCLGLLPTSESGWPTAVRALRLLLGCFN